MVRLPAQRSQHFALYVEWLYSGIVFSASEDGGTEETEEQKSQERSLLLSLCVLGGVIQDTAFQNTVLDAFIERMGTMSHYPRIVVYRRFKILPPASPLRKLLVDTFLQFHSSNWLDESIDYYPKELLLVVSKALMEKCTCQPLEEDVRIKATGG